LFKLGAPGLRRGGVCSGKNGVASIRRAEVGTRKIGGGLVITQPIPPTFFDFQPRALQKNRRGKIRRRVATGGVYGRQQTRGIEFVVQIAIARLKKTGFAGTLVWAKYRKSTHREIREKIYLSSRGPGSSGTFLGLLHRLRIRDSGQFLKASRLK